jgi:hypothetical protein
VANKAIVIPMDTSRIRLDTLISLDDRLDECLADYKKITDAYKGKRSKNKTVDAN